MYVLFCCAFSCFCSVFPGSLRSYFTVLPRHTCVEWPAIGSCAVGESAGRFRCSSHPGRPSFATYCAGSIFLLRSPPGLPFRAQSAAPIFACRILRLVGPSAAEVFVTVSRCIPFLLCCCCAGLHRPAVPAPRLFSLCSVVPVFICLLYS